MYPPSVKKNGRKRTRRFRCPRPQSIKPTIKKTQTDGSSANPIGQIAVGLSAARNCRGKKSVAIPKVAASDAWTFARRGCARGRMHQIRGYGARARARVVCRRCTGGAMERESARAVFRLFFSELAIYRPLPPPVLSLSP